MELAVVDAALSLVDANEEEATEEGVVVEVLVAEALS